jgi:tellurite resistance protein TerC
MNIYVWAGFFLLIFILLALDLGVFNRKSHEIKIKEALTWSIFWISLALLFNYGVYLFMGKVKALEFLSGYLIEKSLSVDNLFVFLMIFSFLKVNVKHQHKVLFWGIVAALLLRALFIFTGVALINKFHWIIYIFGFFLMYSGIRMLFHVEKEAAPDQNPLVKLFKKYFPITQELHGDKFFIKVHHRIYATPLFIALLVVEFTDLIFAVDSIPAILAISHDPFIIFTSNVFAILGLRALYFVLAGISAYFYYLKYGLSAILVFVGFKMLASNYIKIPIMLSLFIIGGLLTLTILISIIHYKRNK